MTFRSDRSQRFFKIGVLKNFANFTGKSLCWSLQHYGNKPSTQEFFCGIFEIFKKPFFTKHFRWLWRKLTLNGLIVFSMACINFVNFLRVRKEDIKLYYINYNKLKFYFRNSRRFKEVIRQKILHSPWKFY